MAASTTALPRTPERQLPHPPSNLERLRAQVVVAQVDAHELFRAAAAAAGVVVLVRQVVLPDTLGAALRNHTALDDVE